MTEQTGCKKCGNCCKQGGPALHESDLDLVREGKIPLSSLITIRKGELAHSPLTGDIQPTGVELVKIIGTGRQWDCCNYDEKRGCKIYANRPQACMALKCWDTEDILKLVEKETLSRFDIISAGDPLGPVIKEYEHKCPSPEFLFIMDNIGKLSDLLKKELEKKVRDDLRFRTRVTRDFDLKLSEELFYFGRPLFQLLQPLGATISETPSGVALEWKN